MKYSKNLSRASGGIAISFSRDLPCAELNNNTSLQVQTYINCLTTICTLYLQSNYSGS